MRFLTLSLLSLAACESYALYLGEPPKLQGLHLRTEQHATECSDTTEPTVWYLYPEVEGKVAFVSQEPDTGICRTPSFLTKRQRQLTQNIFNKICKREITGKKVTRGITRDIQVPVDGAIQSVPMPGGGRVEMQADSVEHELENGETRNELAVTVRNRSQCPLRLEWLTNLRLFNVRRGDPGNNLAPRELDATPLRQWQDNPNGCEIGGLQPTDHVAIAVRLIITAFTGYSC